MSKLIDIDRLFNGRHFDREVIVLRVRWYLRYKLSLRDLVEIMAERGLSLAHTTIMRWVKRFMPEFLKRWTGSQNPLVVHGESMSRMVRPASVARAHGGEAACACLECRTRWS